MQELETMAAIASSLRIASLGPQGLERLAA